MKAILRESEAFKKDAEAAFMGAIEKGATQVKLDAPFESLLVIIQEDEPSNFLMMLSDKKSGKTGYIVSSLDLQ